MKKKILSATLVATLLASTALMGCTSDEPEKETGSNGDSKVTVELGIWPSDDLVNDVATFEGYKEAMEEKYKNVEIVPANYKYDATTFLPMVEAGNCPTILETWFTEPQKLIRNGLIKDITDVLEEKGWLEHLSPALKTLFSDSNGRVYAVPRDAYALGIMCNVDLFEQAGLVDEDGIPIFPKTWEELAETAKKIKDETGMAGFVYLAKDIAQAGWHFSNIAWCFGATLCVDNGDGTFTSQLNTEEAIEAMQYVYDLKWKYDVLTDDPMSEDWGTGFAHIGVGTAAMYIGANDAVNQPTNVYKLDVKKLAMCPIPAGPNGDQYSLSGGTPYVFAKDATDEEVAAALDFLEIMGKSPFVSEESIEGMKSGAASNVANGVPVIKGFTCWTTPERLQAEAEVIEEYKNVDDRMFATYFEKTAEDGNLHGECPGETQRMYQELTKVIQEIFVNENADIPALLDVADENYQKILDGEAE